MQHNKLYIRIGHSGSTSTTASSLGRGEVRSLLRAVLYRAICKMNETIFQTPNSTLKTILSRSRLCKRRRIILHDPKGTFGILCTLSHLSIQLEWYFYFPSPNLSLLFLSKLCQNSSSPRFLAKHLTFIWSL